MQKRKDPLECGEYYHIFSRSIAKYVVFNDAKDFRRMRDLLKLFRYADFEHKLSRFNDLDAMSQAKIVNNIEKNYNLLVEVIAYCIMPTHIHLILKQVKESGISKYMARVLNGYSKYFNVKHKRLGPLWAGRFKSVLVKNDIQLIHLTRYIHLNPSSVGLVDNPEYWIHSSYHEYIGTSDKLNTFCAKDNLFDFTEKTYKKFVLDQKSYQQDLSLIKSLLIEDYTG